MIMEDYKIRKFPNGWTIVCWDREINRRGLRPVYQFTFRDAENRVLASASIRRSACAQAPEGAATVRGVVWGYLFGVPVMVLAWGRYVRID